MDVLAILSGNIFLMIPHYCSFEPPHAPTDGYDTSTECTLIGSGSLHRVFQTSKPTIRDGICSQLGNDHESVF